MTCGVKAPVVSEAERDEEEQSLRVVVMMVAIKDWPSYIYPRAALLCGPF